MKHIFKTIVPGVSKRWAAALPGFKNQKVPGWGKNYRKC